MKYLKLVSSFLILALLACEQRYEVVFNDNIKFNVQIAETPAEREKGLMYVKELPEKSGMLFVFQKEEKLSFWMRNTFIPLDLVFIDKNLKVAGFVKNARILNDEPLTINKDAQYVLEINGGMADKYGIKEGQTVKIPK